MTAVGSEISGSHISTKRAARPGRVIDLFHDPLRTFVVLAVLVGGYLVFTVPYFGGVDETAHFYRSYQMSTGHLLPERVDKSGFSGACVPFNVILGVDHDAVSYYRHVLLLEGKRPGPALPITRAEIARCPSSTSRGLVTFSTFGSPVPYLPQAAAILVTRSVGFGVNGMLLAGRLAVLASYVLVVAVAIRRSPRAKWAICATALLPVALFQSASLSHDAMTTAVALFVLSSALRAAAPSTIASPRRLLVEALVASTVLGMYKPVYIVVAFCYLLPLLGAHRRPQLRILAWAPVLTIVVSAAWNQAVRDLWKTDADYFNIHPDPGRQRHELLTTPWNFAFDALRTIWEQLWDWLHTLVSVGSSVTHWPTALAAVLVVVYAVVALQADRSEPERGPVGLASLQRGLLVAVFVAGALLIIGANYVYWTDPGQSVVHGVQARYFMPLIAVLPVALGPLGLERLRARTAHLPVALGLVPALLVFLLSVSFRMH